MYRYFLILFIHISIVIFSQERRELKFIHYTTNEGLSSNEALKIVQDNLGFIWVGTVDGLNRFDGYSFKVYRKKTNDSTSLCDNMISALYVDISGELWIGTKKGLSFYNRSFDSFINYYPYDNDNSSQSNNVTAIVEDRNGKLYMSLEHEIYKFNRITGEFTEVIKMDPEIRYLFFDSDNNLWILTDSQIRKYNSDMILIGNIINPQVKYPYSCMIEDGDKYWISTNGNGMFWYDKNTKSLVRTFHNDIYEDYINTIYKDRQNNVWIGCLSSLKLYDRKNDKFHYYYADEHDEYSLSTNGIWTFFQDKEGNYWCLTDKGGVNVSLVEKQFSNITPDLVYSLAITKRNISSLLIDSENRIWAGAYNAGLDIVDFVKWKVTHFDHDSLKKGSIGANSVLMLYEDKQKNIWVGTYRGGLQLYNKNTNSFITYKHNENDPNSIGGNDIRAMAEDNTGNLWLATAGNGLDKFDRKNNKFIHFKHNPYNYNHSLINNWLYSLLYDTEGNLWIGSSFGLSMMDIEKEIFTNYYNDPNDSTSLSNNFINYIFEDSKHNIWVGTNEGLNLFNKETKTFIAYFQKDGLPNSVIKGILEDDRENLWVSTNNGISKFNPKFNNFRNYDIHDGLSSDEFYKGACSKNSTGQLFFGSNNGIVYFFPDSIKDNRAVPLVFITELKLFNTPVIVGGQHSPLSKHIIQTKELTLNHKQSAVISFEFVSISYNQSNRRQYAYMMEGFDKEWVYSGNKREATYTNLDPGNYTFRVKASNHDNIWNEKGTFIKIIIKPPWWKTFWFRILIILTIIGIFISFYFIKTRSLIIQKNTLENLVKERTREIEEKNITLTSLNATKDKMFSIIAHDLRNPFNSILGFSEVLDIKFDELEYNEKRKYIRTISDSSQNVYKLLENLLQWARSQTGSVRINPKRFSLHKVIKNNIELVTHLLNKKKITLNFNISEDLMVYADKNMISTVIRNLLTNSIKFMERGEINIWAEKLNGSIKISIRDTGIGMSVDQLNSIFDIGESKSTYGTRGEKGTGLGLIICKDFIEKNNGTISIESELEKGTTFYISLPAKE